MRIAQVLLALVLVSVLVRGSAHAFYTQDTDAMIHGTTQILECLERGNWIRCKFRSDPGYSEVNPYPLLQYLPAIVLTLVGMTAEASRKTLTWINTAAIALSVSAIARWSARRGGEALVTIALVTLLTGILTAYAFTSFGEPLAILAVTATALLAMNQTGGMSMTGTHHGHRTTWPLALAAAAATISKETIAPVIVLAGLGFVLVSGVEAHERHRRYFGLFAGVLTGLALNAAFNLFRFGSIFNVDYLNDPRPSPWQGLINLGSLWIAPNVGLIWFWPTLAVCLGLLTIFIVRHRSSHFSHPDHRFRAGAALLLGSFMVGFVSLGLWWGPFGWHSWGPRFILPLSLPPIIGALALSVPDLSGGLDSARRRMVLLAALGSLSLLPNVGILWNPEAWMTHMDTTLREETCGLPDRGIDTIESCNLRAAWRTDAMPLLEALQPSNRAPWFWFTVIAANCGILLAITTARFNRQGALPTSRVKRKSA